MRVDDQRIWRNLTAFWHKYAWNEIKLNKMTHRILCCRGQFLVAMKQLFFGRCRCRCRCRCRYWSELNFFVNLRLRRHRHRCWEIYSCRCWCRLAKSKSILKFFGPMPMSMQIDKTIFSPPPGPPSRLQGPRAGSEAHPGPSEALPAGSEAHPALFMALLASPDALHAASVAQFLWGNGLWIHQLVRQIEPLTM